MCGILAILNIKEGAEGLRNEALRMVKRIRHRGPDWSGVYNDQKAILAHERLSIVDVEHGAQPLQYRDKGLVLAVNGEIYNHQTLRRQYLDDCHHLFQTASDCEPLLYLYDKKGPDFLNLLNGIFAFVLYDAPKGEVFIARDPIGVIPLYWGRDDLGRIYVASEMKAIIDHCTTLEEFPPGHYYYGGKLVRYYQPEWREKKELPVRKFEESFLRNALEEAVKRQLMCDVPYGVLLSGGLDSSLIAAITKKFAKGRVEDGGKSEAWWPQIHSFSVGLEGAPDLLAARKVAKFLGTIHHEIHFTIQEGIDALHDVIHHLETFDVTTIRAATPMYLMSRKIKAMGIKMVLSGEGSDEIFGGYLYFHKAPNAREFHEETVRKLGMLHLYDCLRANKSTAAWGVEARVPFLDVEFLKVAMDIDPQEKMISKGRMEKHILRSAFKGYLPEEILWRQKEQFSDGVGHSWIDSLKKHAEGQISDEKMKKAGEIFPLKTPLTKEAFFYRLIFDKFFPGEEAAKCVPWGPSVACSTPAAIQWDASFAKMNDPSGRAVVGVHEQSYSLSPDAVEDKKPSGR